ncbi:hypothetical protein B0H17DRAFT_1197026 [Mycena rosella]|uniref:Uncharacterized protein n=1 Tax=Mycena rosella TaxID=1033263 RepID=A0AAD7DS15_MYCRO|nr:hypothetical protein B0H17DRAFT_1197026 [Mycena rosella]
MLALRLRSFLRPPPRLLPCYSVSRSLHWRIPRALPALQKTKTRLYSDVAEARLREQGIPLANSAPTTAALLAYADGNWHAPSVIPAGWSSDWKSWTHLLTLFAYSSYFLRLPQIEMLVNVKHGIPGEVRPLMFHHARDALVFQVDVPDTGGAQVHYLDCARFELWTYAREDVDTIEELCLLIGAASTPEGVPLVRVDPDPDGEAAIKRILARDESVVAALEREFLGYAPRVTTPEEELVSADEQDRVLREKLADGIRRTRANIQEAEEELAEYAQELAEELETGVPSEQLEEDQRAHVEMRAAVEEAKTKAAEWELLWESKYGKWVEE